MAVVSTQTPDGAPGVVAADPDLLAADGDVPGGGDGALELQRRAAEPMLGLGQHSLGQLPLQLLPGVRTLTRLVGPRGIGPCGVGPWGGVGGVELGA
jgi:hypothetical protein